MIEGEVTYKNLGRHNAKGKIKIKCETAEEFNSIMEKEFKKHLMSSNISFSDGIIFAGFHTVGEYEFIAVEK